MTSGLRISDVAARTGFATSTLRYYEQIGMLPPPDRTPAGYRSFDETVVPRLAFIDRARQLGLPLEEIRELVAVWDDGLCAHVQGRLRELIAAKSVEVRARLAELSAFGEQLDASAAQLTGEAPTGRCGDSCGCATLSVPEQVAPALHQLGPTRRADSREGAARASESRVPIVCTLAARERPERVQAWDELLAQVQRREALEGGVRLVFPPEPELAGRLAVLATREHGCCSFFTFTLRPAVDALVLDVQAPEDAAPLVAGLFGAVA